jgi:hypothetical protein
MKRFDRAMYAMFLLVLLADVARAHASVPAGGESGLILSAASQIQVSPTGDAILVLRGSNGASSQIMGFKHFRLSFSGWSRNLSDLSNPAMRSASIAEVDVGSDSRFLPAAPSAFSSLAIFEHSGSPAP